MITEDYRWKSVVLSGLKMHTYSPRKKATKIIWTKRLCMYVCIFCLPSSLRQLVMIPHWWIEKIIIHSFIHSIHSFIHSFIQFIQSNFFLLETWTLDIYNLSTGIFFVERHTVCTWFCNLSHFSRAFFRFLADSFAPLSLVLSQLPPFFSICSSIGMCVAQW